MNLISITNIIKGVMLGSMLLAVILIAYYIW